MVDSNTLHIFFEQCKSIIRTIYDWNSLLVAWVLKLFNKIWPGTIITFKQFYRIQRIWNDYFVSMKINLKEGEGKNISPYLSILYITAFRFSLYPMLHSILAPIQGAMYDVWEDEFNVVKFASVWVCMYPYVLAFIWF